MQVPPESILTKNPVDTQTDGVAFFGITKPSDSLKTLKISTVLGKSFEVWFAILSITSTGLVLAAVIITV